MANPLTLGKKFQTPRPPPHTLDRQLIENISHRLKKKTLPTTVDMQVSIMEKLLGGVNFFTKYQGEVKNKFQTLFEQDEEETTPNKLRLWEMKLPRELFL